jgi:hypothetical protein
VNDAVNDRKAGRVAKESEKKIMAERKGRSGRSTVNRAIRRLKNSEEDEDSD